MSAPAESNYDRWRKRLTAEQIINTPLELLLLQAFYAGAEAGILGLAESLAKSRATFESHGATKQ